MTLRLIPADQASSALTPSAGGGHTWKKWSKVQQLLDDLDELADSDPVVRMEIERRQYSPSHAGDPIWLTTLQFNLVNHPEEWGQRIAEMVAEGSRRHAELKKTFLENAALDLSDLQDAAAQALSGSDTVALALGCYNGMTSEEQKELLDGIRKVNAGQE